MLGWLRRAAHQAEEINRHLLRALPVTEVQLDEMWDFIERKHTCETDATGESGPDSADGRQWVWISFAPEFRLMIAAIVGPRTLDTPRRSWPPPKARVAGIPALLAMASRVIQRPDRRLPRGDAFACTGKRGRPCKPRCEPHPDLVYGQSVK